jgi:hypothetical protein
VTLGIELRLRGCGRVVRRSEIGESSQSVVAVSQCTTEEDGREWRVWREE